MILVTPDLLTVQCYFSEVGDQRSIIPRTTNLGFVGGGQRVTHGPPRVTGKILYT